MAEIICGERSTREVNAEIKQRIRDGEAEIVVRDPGARHNLAVAVLSPVRIRLKGSAGYFCAGLIDGPTVEIGGSAGWGLAESMMGGLVVVEGNAGNGAAAAIRGGTVVIHGDAAARLGASMKGGLVIVGGDCGYMAGFMGQKGTLIICGDTGEAFGDSMYATVCFVGGRIGDLGTDAVIDKMNESEIAFVEEALAANLPPELRRTRPPARDFQKVVAGRKLWNFDHREWKIWQEAL
jgi:methylamine---glutamate N-methyltransferase subunit B